MKLKKIAAGLLSLALVSTMAGCGKSATPSTPDVDTPEQTNAADNVNDDNNSGDDCILCWKIST